MNLRQWIMLIAAAVAVLLALATLYAAGEIFSFSLLAAFVVFCVFCLVKDEIEQSAARRKTRRVGRTVES